MKLGLGIRNPIPKLISVKKNQKKKFSFFGYFWIFLVFLKVKIKMKL